MVSNAGLNNARLEALLHRAFSNLKGEPGFWTAQLEDDLDIYVMTDEVQDRIRILIPVAEAERTDRDLLWVLLVANYELAVDARYAIHDGLVWCTFAHRLSWLTEAELDNALANVITLAKNTGTTFSSSDLMIGGT